MKMATVYVCRVLPRALHLARESREVVEEDIEDDKDLTAASTLAAVLNMCEDGKNSVGPSGSVISNKR